jgi:hypothetical protein
VDFLTLTGGSSAASGGAILNRGDLTLYGDTLSQNTAHDGGAVMNYGTLQVQSGQFANNRADGDGGAIFNASGATADVDWSACTGNSAGDQGAVVHNVGTMNILGMRASANTATEGGGALDNLGTMTVSGGAGVPFAIFVDNNGLRGGAILNSGTLRISRAGIDQNTGGDGAAIYNSGDLSLSYCTLDSNSATSDAGGIYNTGNVTMTYTDISNNTADWCGGIDNLPGAGGAPSSLTMANSLINRNADKFAVGGLWPEGNPVTLTNTLIGGNWSQHGVRDVSGTVSGTSNLISDGTGMFGITNGVDGNLVGTSSNPLTASGHDGVLYFLLDGNLYKVGSGVVVSGVSALAQGSNNAIYYLQKGNIYQFQIDHSDLLASNVSGMAQGAGDAVYYLQSSNLYQLGQDTPLANNVTSFTVVSGQINVTAAAGQWGQTTAEIINARAAAGNLFSNALPYTDPNTGTPFTFTPSNIAPDGYEVRDVQQGLADDCVFCAAMASAVSQHVNLAALIQYSGGTTYMVSFYGETSQIVNFDGRVYVADVRPLIDSQGNLLNAWAIILQRAYFQVHGVNWASNEKIEPGLLQGWTSPKVAQYSLIGGVKNNWNVGYAPHTTLWIFGSGADDDAMQKMSAALQAGNIVTVGCNDNTVEFNVTSAHGHEFAVLALGMYNGVASVELYNPHAYPADGSVTLQGSTTPYFGTVINGVSYDAEGTFILPWTVFSEHFGAFTTCGQDV